MSYPPPITSYPSHANLLSVILNHEEAKPWFYNYYIQLEAPSGGNGVRLDFYTTLLYKTCPWIYYQRVSRELAAKKWSSITEFIIDSIDLGYYVYLMVDEYFIPGYMNYQQEHQRHDIFIFGYDLESKTFNVADCFLDGRYYYTTAAFDRIETGYHHIPAAEDWMDGIELIRFRKKHEYNFDLSLILCFIEDYLNSQNTSQRYKIPSEYWCDGMPRQSFVFGLKIYDLLQEHLEQSVKQKTDPDLRPFHVLWDHKTVMVSRIKFLGENQYLRNADSFYQSYREIARESLIVRNLLIKMLFLGNDTKIKSMQMRLTQIAATEREVLLRMLECLNNIPSTKI